MSKQEETDKEIGRRLVSEVLTSDDIEYLRNIALEMMGIVGFLFKRNQMQTLLYPIFFLAGFLGCYFVVK